MTDTPRLIEHSFPLKQASLNSVHEKNVRHGHISTLHIWPVQRPLAACRVASIATLVPAPSTEARLWDSRGKHLRRVICRSHRDPQPGIAAGEASPPQVRALLATPEYCMRDLLRPERTAGNLTNSQLFASTSNRIHNRMGRPVSEDTRGYPQPKHVGAQLNHSGGCSSGPRRAVHLATQPWCQQQDSEMSQTWRE
jgi:hypothetical protein